MQNLVVLNCNKIIYPSYRLLSSLPSEKHTLISRVRYVLRNYWLGSKLLYQNYKTVQQIRKKDISSLTRNDRLTLDQFRYDVRVGTPFIILFSLPIIGYTAPLLALLTPKYLPSTLILPKQKVKFLEGDAFKSSLITDSLIESCRNKYGHNNIQGTISIMQFLEQLSNSNDRYDIIMSSIPTYPSLFNECVSLSTINRKHLLMLHKSVLHSSFVARYFLSNYSLERQLEMWQYRTLIDDKKLTNLEKLTPHELVACLYSRGLYLHVHEMGQIFENEQRNTLNKLDKKHKKTDENIKINDNILNDWRQLLYQWIEIHKKLSKSNRISTSFLLHIAPLLPKQ